MELSPGGPKPGRLHRTGSDAMMTSGFWSFFLFAVLALGFACIPLLLSSLIQPRARRTAKESTYECGMRSFGDARVKFDVKYYVFALLFLIFDIEAVFLFPWSVVFEEVGLFGLVEIGIFLTILTAGLVYAWRKKALQWD
jgi:NADH-quinone oxidoreductase subunit A